MYFMRFLLCLLSLFLLSCNEHEDAIYSYQTIKWTWGPEVLIHQMKKNKQYTIHYPEKDLDARDMVINFFKEKVTGTFLDKNLRFMNKGFLLQDNLYKNNDIIVDKKILNFQKRFEDITSHFPNINDRFWNKAKSIHHVFLVLNCDQNKDVTNIVAYYSPDNYEEDQLLLAYAIFVNSNRDKFYENLIELYNKPNQVINSHKYRWEKENQSILSLLETQGIVWYFNYDNIEQHLRLLEHRVQRMHNQD
jgi:hypothetical protein